MGRDIKILGVSSLALEGLECSIRTWQRTYEDMRLPLLGYHQAENLATAIGAMEVLAGSSNLAWDGTVAKGALPGLKCPARIEIVSRRPLVVLDAAHNVSSVKALVNTLRQAVGFERLILVLGLLVDKDLDGIFEEVAPVAYKVILTAADMPRSTPPHVLAERIRPHLGGNAEALVADSPGEALRLAKRLARPGDCICITGSFYLAGNIQELLEGKGYEGV